MHNRGVKNMSLIEEQMQIFEAIKDIDPISELDHLSAKKFKIVSGGKLIVLGVDHNGFERVLLMKSEAVTKMFGYLLDVKKVVGEDRIENIEKAIKKSGLKELEKPISKGKKKGLKFKVDV